MNRISFEKYKQSICKHVDINKYIPSNLYKYPPSELYKIQSKLDTEIQCLNEKLQYRKNKKLSKRLKKVIAFSKLIETILSQHGGNMMIHFNIQPIMVINDFLSNTNWELDGQKALGRGGYKQVWKIKNKIDGSSAIINLPIDNRPEKILGFQSDFDSLYNLRNRLTPCTPDIICPIEFDTSGDNLFYITNLFDKGSLHNLIQYGNYNPMDIMFKLSMSLQTLHSKDIVHSDLKPDNIMLYNDPPSPGLIDLGISCLNICNHNIGTLSYMPPEVINASLTQQANNCNYLHSKSRDIWALGCIFYELLTKEQLFEFETKPLRILNNNGSLINYSVVEHNSICQTKILNMTVNSNIKNLLRNMLHENCQQRYQINDVINVLKPPTLPTPPTSPVKSPILKFLKKIF